METTTLYQPMTTGLDELDHVLSFDPFDKTCAGLPTDTPKDYSQRGGFACGQVTEVWGPPGVGKTTLGMQTAVYAIRDKQHVAWVDCFFEMGKPRLAEIYRHVRQDREPEEAEAADADLLHHFNCTTMAHFMALLCKPVARVLHPDSSLIIIDSLTALINSTYPKTAAKSGYRERSAAKKKAVYVARFRVLQFIMGALQKVAASRNCAVVLLSQSATKLHWDTGGASLVPAIDAKVWDQGISTRVALFRDWAMLGKVKPPPDTSSRRLPVPRKAYSFHYHQTPVDIQSVWFALVQKRFGQAPARAMSATVSYQVKSFGIVPIYFHRTTKPDTHLSGSVMTNSLRMPTPLSLHRKQNRKKGLVPKKPATNTAPTHVSTQPSGSKHPDRPGPSSKRKLGDTELMAPAKGKGGRGAEEDYDDGWDEADDEALIPHLSQWEGSQPQGTQETSAARGSQAHGRQAAVENDTSPGLGSGRGQHEVIDDSEDEDFGDDIEIDMDALEEQERHLFLVRHPTVATPAVPRPTAT